MAACEVHNLLLGNLRYAVDGPHLCSPRPSLDEGLHKHVGPCSVVAQLLVILQLHVVDDRRQQSVVKVAASQLAHFLQHDPAKLLKRLPVFRLAEHKHRRIVGVSVNHHGHPLHEHLLLEVCFHQPRLTVGKHERYHPERVGLHIGRPLEPPAKHEALCLLPHYGGVDG